MFNYIGGKKIKNARKSLTTEKTEILQAEQKKITQSII